ncbi:hypothetical protein V1264_022407 [Littorina saxatilis]|uniref:SSD domain-containing protein n=1 Tax=Littorina saxatilis TaxID=31220 RepID=A0AAN9AKJ8_9CAEN
MTCLTKYAMRVTGCFCRLFYRLGKLVAKYPFPFVILPVLIFSTLGVFFYFADHQSNVEDMYTPINSRGHKEKIRVKSLFEDGSDENFNAMALNDNQLGIGIILQQRNKSNILTETSLDVIHDVADQIKNITMIIDVEIVVPKSTRDIWTIGLNMTSEGHVTSDNYVTLKQYESANDRSGLADDVKVMTITRAVTLEDICARLKGKCQTDGFYFLTDEFREAYRNGTVEYPYWNSPWGSLDLSRSLGNVNVTDNGRVRSAQAVRLIFNFRRNTEHVEHLSFEWEKHYVIVAPDLDYGDLDFAFSASHSLGNELDKGTKGDIGIFAMTFALMIFYAAMVTAGGDCVSSRALLALGGVLAAVLGIFGSLGLIGLLGVPFVNIVGCMPFLVLGIGVDDMFLMMAAWSGTLGNRDLTIPERLATTFRSAGIGITITSLTDGLAFVVGGFTSVFQSVRNFCIYTGTAVFICYVCNLTFFGGCMALHGRRVYSERHTLTCRKVKGHDKLYVRSHFGLMG